MGDVLTWDNVRARHYAVRDYDDTVLRLMHRIAGGGDQPVLSNL